MRDTKSIVAVFSSFLASLIGALFVVGYTNIHAMNAHHHFGTYNSLPWPAKFFMVCSGWALLIPGAMAIFGVLLLRKDRFSDLVLAVYVAGGWLFAFSWALGCIVTWELPWMAIGGVVEQ